MKIRIGFFFFSFSSRQMRERKKRKKKTKRNEQNITSFNFNLSIGGLQFTLWFLCQCNRDTPTAIICCSVGKSVSALCESLISLFLFSFVSSSAMHWHSNERNIWCHCAQWVCIRIDYVNICAQMVLSLL